MSDYNSSLPVRTQTNGDVVAQIVDGTIITQKLAIDAAGAITDVNDGPVTPGTVASKSGLIGGQYNTVLPTLTNTQQAAVQVDDRGRLLVSTTPVSTDDHNYGVVGANTLRTAAQIGNATGAADFNYGTVGAQTLRVAAEPGNATGIADFNAGATGAQTPRVVANIMSAAGTAFSNANPLPVIFSTSPAGTEVNDYNTAASLAALGTSNHDYTVTAATTFEFTQVWASASGKLKIEVRIETGVATGVFNTKFVGFNSTATPNIDLDLTKPITVAAGVRVRVIRTNLDNSSQDVYSTISGSEI